MSSNLSETIYTRVLERTVDKSRGQLFFFSLNKLDKPRSRASQNPNSSTVFLNKSCLSDFIWEFQPWAEVFIERIALKLKCTDKEREHFSGNYRLEME